MGLVAGENYHRDQSGDGSYLCPGFVHPERAKPCCSPNPNPGALKLREDFNDTTGYQVMFGEH